MSIVCGAIKGGKVAISSDTLSKFGAVRASARYLKNSTKLIGVRDSVIGVVGWGAMLTMIEHLGQTKKTMFRLGSRREILETLLKLHPLMKKDYFLESKENDDQPVESNQLNALIVNPNGLFEIGSYKEVNQYKTFWAVGSGQDFALGAMHAMYSRKVSARSVAEAGVVAAAEFEDCCGLPLESKVIDLA